MVRLSQVVFSRNGLIRTQAIIAPASRPVDKMATIIGTYASAMAAYDDAMARGIPIVHLWLPNDFPIAMSHRRDTHG